VRRISYIFSNISRKIETLRRVRKFPICYRCT
jgi:hypothetical protein